MELNFQLPDIPAIRASIRGAIFNYHHRFQPGTTIRTHTYGSGKWSLFPQPPLSPPLSNRAMNPVSTSRHDKSKLNSNSFRVIVTGCQPEPWPQIPHHTHSTPTWRNLASLGRLPEKVLRSARIFTDARESSRGEERIVIKKQINNIHLPLGSTGTFVLNYRVNLGIASSRLREPWRGGRNMHVYAHTWVH